MKINSFTNLLKLATATSLCVVALTFAQPPRGCGDEQGPGCSSAKGGSVKHQPGAKQDQLKEYLGLTDAQEKSVKEIMDTHRAKAEKLRISLERTDLDIREQLLAVNPDMNKIKNSVDAKTKILGEMEMENINKDLQIKKLLTPEQQNKLKMMMQRHKFGQGHPQPMGDKKGPGAPSKK